MTTEDVVHYDGFMKNIKVIHAKYKNLEIDNLELNENEIIFLKGQSGIGKTTLINLLTASNNNVKGMVFIDEKTCDLKVLRDVSRVVHQKQEINSINGTILQVLTGYIELKEEHQEQVKKLRDIFEILKET